MAGIRIQLELDDGTFTTRMLHAGESLDKFNEKVGQTAVAFQRVEPAHRSFIGHMRDVIVIVAAVRLAFDNLRMVTTGWAKDIIQVNAEFERLTYLLRGMSSAADPMKQATDQVRQLRDLSLQMPYSMKAITDTFVKLRASGTDPMQGSLQAVIDTVAAFGGTESQLKRASLALQEMAGKGVVQTKELRRQLGQDIPRAIELMARALGVSIPQLSALIAKGTLDAGTSMEAMYAEWERTFGGAAKRMMSTFNGLLEQTQTLIQNLALDVGNAGFFEETKRQLKQFNEFLAGNQAKVLARNFGDAMGAVIGGLRGALDWVVRFRNEILHVGEVIVIAFGARVAIASLLALGSFIRGVSTAAIALRGELQALNAAWQFNSIGIAIGKLGMAGMGISTLTGYARYARIALLALGTSLSFVSQFIIPLAAVVLAAAYAWGLFEDKVEDAYQAVKKYGSVSKEQLELAQQKLDVAERELMVLYKRQELQGNRENYALGDYEVTQTKDMSAEIDAKKAANREIADVLAAGRVASAKAEAEAKLRIDEALIDKDLLQMQRANDVKGQERQKAFTKEIAAMDAHQQDTSQRIKNNQEAQRDQAREYAQQQYDFYEAHIERLKELMDKHELDSDTGGLMVDHYRKKMQDLRREIESAHVVTPQKNTLGMSLEEALKKAQQMLTKVNSDIAGYKAGLAGANDELAKFIYLLEHREKTKLDIYGNQELDAFIKQLKEGKKTAEEFKAEFEGQSKFDHSILTEAEKINEKWIELKTDGKNGFNKILAEAQLGAFQGVKPISLIGRMYADVDLHARKAAEGQSLALGDTMQAKGRGMLGVVQDLADAWKKVGRAAANATPAGQISTPVPGKYTPRPGQATLPGVDYMSNTAWHESGNNPDAESPTGALGLYQFVKRTWLDFIKAIHPEILARGEDYALSQRKDPDLSREGAAWYSAKNSKALYDAGVEVNDANVYLAHFLGTKGAIETLTKSANTLLTDIPILLGPHGSIANNPGIYAQNKTVGDLKAWAQSFEGTGSTAPTSKNDFLQLEELLKYSKNPEKDRSVLLQAMSRQRENERLGGAKNERDEIQNLRATIAGLDENLKPFGKEVAKVVHDIHQGKYGEDRDENSPQHKLIMDRAAEVDAKKKAEEEEARANEKAATIIKELPLRLEEADKALAAANKRIEESSLVKPNRGVAAKDELADRQKKEIDVATNLSPEQKKKAIDDLTTWEMRKSNEAAAQVIANEQKKIEKLKEEVGTAAEKRQREHDDEFKRLDEELAKVNANAAGRIAAEQKVAEEKRLLDKKLTQSSPLAAEMKSWSDIGQSFGTASAGWMNTFTDNLAKMTMRGQVNWTQMVNSMITDIIRLTIRSAIGNLFGMSGMGSLLSGGSGGSGGGKSAAGGAGKLGGGAGKLGARAGTVGVNGIGAAAGGDVLAFHSGGIVGWSSAPKRMVDMRHFMRAPRFHEGGFPGLDNSEVPIIAKKGEEIGWPEQFAKKYGGSNQMVNNHVINTTVNATGGRPQDNQDLAERVGRSVQQSLRTMVAGEIRMQLKPGGILAQ